MSLLPKDTDLQFPHVFVITASAGSGKTYTLSRRYAQYLLSEHVAGNSLRSILSVTFTNLAAKEMKERILTVLKEAALGNKKLLGELSELISLSEEQISLRASRLTDEILQNYSDFNVRTIDSFMSTVFKASALEFGYQPDVDISLDPEALIQQTFEAFSRDLKEGSADARFIDELIVLIEENERGQSSFLWNPFTKIIREVRQLQSQLGRYALEPKSEGSAQQRRELAATIIQTAKQARKEFDDSGLPLSSYFSKDIDRLIEGDILAVAEKKQWEKYFTKFDKEQEAVYERIKKRLFAPVNTLNDLLDEYVEVYAQGYYEPFLRAVKLVDGKLREIKRLEGTVMIDDINRTLASYLVNADIPQVYIKLGETIHHFMIDEFQDTSPIQWFNLHPLIENSLATHGSLFVVGDTKQSIYGFRGADWRIMKKLETNPAVFPSAHHQIFGLDTNYRSSEALVDFVKEVFNKKTKEVGYDEFAKESGLLDFTQKVPDAEQGKGYAEVKFIHQSDDGDDVAHQQRDHVIATINDCVKRGYTYADIAILTPANAEVVQISSWLNEAKIPFISHSTLDVRRRKIIGELIAFLRFLDSPIDNLSFVTFVLGDVFQKLLAHDEITLAQSTTRRKAGSNGTNSRFRGNDIVKGNREILHDLLFEGRNGYFFRTFRKQYPRLWEQYFETLYSRVGYMPLYDLVSETFKTLSVFETCKNEESALIKFLECVKSFENSGNNSIKDFLSFSSEGSDGDEWSIDVPTNVRAVRVMTVHKAKGLGFPVVITLFKDKSRKNFGPIIDETDDGITMLKVTKGLAERNEVLSQLYKQQERENIIDELNRLYVALTRAQREMYVVSLVAKDKKTKAKGEEEKKIPSMLFPDTPFGKKYSNAEAKAGRESPARLGESSTAEMEYRTAPAQLPVAQYQKVGLVETLRGDIVHNVLSRIEYISDDIETKLRSHIHQELEKTTIQFDPDEMVQLLTTFLSIDEVKKYFEDAAGKQALREQDFVSASGQLFRMDRVLIDPNNAAVVDFKTGSDEMDDKYQEQVRNYMKILREIYPDKTISGALLYVDMRKAVEVR